MKSDAIYFDKCSIQVSNGLKFALHFVHWQTMLFFLIGYQTPYILCSTTTRGLAGRNSLEWLLGMMPVAGAVPVHLVRNTGSAPTFKNRDYPSNTSMESLENLCYTYQFLTTIIHSSDKYSQYQTVHRVWPTIVPYAQD